MRRMVNGMPAGQLQGVRDIKDEWDAEGAHDRKSAHVNDQIMIAEAHTPFRQ